MTIEQLLDCSPDELEKLSDTELEKILAPYFNVTRPELGAHVKKTGATNSNTKVVTSIKAPKTAADWEKQEKMKAAYEMAKQMGINLKKI
jgi:hypothetical protein